MNEMASWVRSTCFSAAANCTCPGEKKRKEEIYSIILLSFLLRILWRVDQQAPGPATTLAVTTGMLLSLYFTILLYLQYLRETCRQNTSCYSTSQTTSSTVRMLHAAFKLGGTVGLARWRAGFFQVTLQCNFQKRETPP